MTSSQHLSPGVRSAVDLVRRHLVLDSTPVNTATLARMLASELDCYFAVALVHVVHALYLLHVEGVPRATALWNLHKDSEYGEEALRTYFVNE